MSYFRLPYRRQRGVENHTGSILALAVTENAKTLATGGSQGTRLFNMDNMTEVKRPSGAGSRGHTVSLLWARQTEEHHDVLYSGTQNGYFFCWRQDKESTVFEETFATQITHAGEITGLAFDSTNNRLTPTPGCGRRPTFSVKKYSNLLPRSITFAAFDNSSDRDIIVFGSGHNGPVYTLRGTSGERRSEWNIGSYIGGAAVDWSEGVFCVNDPYVGPALFRYANRTKTRTFEGSTIITGSDHGKIYAFDVRSGDTVQTLETGRAKRVKAVATAEIGGEPAIIAAHSYTDEGFQQIFVWKRARSPIAWDTVVTFLQALVLLGFVIFVYQNVVEKMWQQSKWGRTSWEHPKWDEMIWEESVDSL
ncbi:WD-REPEATS-REGION domain-containing protein [Mycena sanguinolenta]|uniref:WD-REPEATS-REGION domain-containing protein n=1 Tax=Mycena sanguinolenta TaxID=230812 RepID=A0A8H6TYF1_9AGAR|nr:WD-REPEATS-REGION domain-containing protein [Mycena sanguinolenta]